MKTKTKKPTSTRPSTDLQSTGMLCQTLQASPGEIRAAAAAAGVVPRLILNGVKYFADEDICLIRQSLKGR